MRYFPYDLAQSRPYCLVKVCIMRDYRHQNIVELLRYCAFNRLSQKGCRVVLTVFQLPPRRQRVVGGDGADGGRLSYGYRDDVQVSFIARGLRYTLGLECTSRRLRALVSSVCVDWRFCTLMALFTGIFACLINVYKNHQYLEISSLTRFF